MSLAILGASGKLGFATLNALLNQNLVSPNQITCTTSSDTGAEKLKAASQQGVQIKRAHWDDASTFERAFAGIDKLFLISSSRIDKDFHDAPLGQGREADHVTALEAAKRAGVKHVVYTSLAFANPSKSRVMKAHERTEAWLAENWNGGGRCWTVLREGLYNESWPLYFGHWRVGEDERSEVCVAGDSKISWTAIGDLGLASALVLAAPSDEWAGKTVYLSQAAAFTLNEVATMASGPLERNVTLKLVPRDEHERFYVREREMPEPYVQWWAKTYDALRDGECEIRDDTLERLLKGHGVVPKAMEETVREMLGASQGYTGSLRAGGMAQAFRA